MTLFRVDFLDHSQDYNQAVKCSVYGKLIEEDDVCLTFETWTMTDPQQDEDLNDSSTFTIIRAAISRIVELSESRAVDRNASLLSPRGREPADLDDRAGPSPEPTEQPVDRYAG